MLRADAEANGGGRDVLLLQFVGRHLRVRSCIGMDDQALDIGHVGQEEKICSLSMNCQASACPPFTSKVKMEPPPCGKYLLYKA